MNTIKIWSRKPDFKTCEIGGFEISPREGEYIQVNNKSHKIDQVIYDIDNSIIICVVD